MAERRTRPAKPKRVPGRAGADGPGAAPDLRTKGHAAADRAALAAALHPIITIDARGIIQSASNSLQRVFGWAPAELVGRNVSVLMPEPHHSAHDGYLEHYRETGKTNILNRPRRFDAVRKDGTLFPMELSVSRAEVPGQGSPLFVGIIRDLSEQAASEHGQQRDLSRLQDLVTEQTEALQAAHLRLRMADRLASIGTLAAGLGHDMNNVLLPVRARLNSLRAAGAKGEISTAAGQHVEEIRKSVAYLQQLADGLYFLAMDPETEDDAGGGGGGGPATDLRGWWSQTGALLAKAVPKHVRVTASIPPGLPEAAVAPHRLTQAVLNLIVNAGEAIPAPLLRKRREGRVRIWARPSADATLVRLGVTDNGRGMTDEVKRRAFEMFFTTKTRGMGTGLGLALVHKVATGAGGEVEVESEVGKGTTVVMMLRAAARSRRGPASAGPMAVISVRDGRAAALIRQVLEAAGARVGDGNNVSHADIWVVDPAETSVREARAWRTGRPHVRLVLLGAPDRRSAAAWRELEPIIIGDRDDFDAVRAALGRAIAAA